MRRDSLRHLPTSLIWSTLNFASMNSSHLKAYSNGVASTNRELGW